MTQQETRRFARTRRDHASETAEDYVEAIDDFITEHGKCRAADLARLFGVSHVTVGKIVLRLEGEGLIQTAPYAPVTLTNKGRRLAQQCRRRHQTVHQFLLAIGVPEETARIDAEGIEHHVSPVTLARFEKMIERFG